MRVLFVRPRPSQETIGLQHVMIVEPLELETLAGLLDRQDTPVILDMILERKSFSYHLQEQNPDVLCVTGYITHVDIMLEYCRKAKEWNPAIRTIVGGVHCEVCPGDLDDPAVDFRVVRNATTVFPDLLEHIRGRGGVPKGILTPGQKISITNLPPFDFRFPLPLRSLTKQYRSRYFYIFHERVALLKTAFGCPYKCTFCFCRAITNGRYVERPLEEVMDELEGIEEKEIYIVDDDFLVDTNRVGRFIDENLKRGLDKRYLLYGRADFIVRNPGVIQRFKEVGLSTVIVGFESFFEEELAQYQKGTTVETNRKAMEILQENGVDCYATVIIPPEWDRHKFDECGAIMKSLGIHYVNLQPLTPLPGTGQSTEESRLVIRRNDYARWDLAHVALRPERLSVLEFYRALIDLYSKILFQPSVLLAYARRYRLGLIWKMTLGTVRVRNQYLRKIREARDRVSQEEAVRA